MREPSSESAHEPAREPELERWRRGAESDTRLSAGELDELEDHLRAAWRDELVRGATPRLAFDRASRRLGDVRALEPHFPRTRTAMNHVTRLLGVALSGAIVLFALDQSGRIATFVAPQMLAVVLGLVAAGLLAGHGLATMSAAARCALTGRRPDDPAQRAALEALARRGYRLSWVAGYLAALMSALVALSAMETPASVMSALARSTFGVLYGALLAELVFANLAAWTAAEAREG